MQTLIRHRMWDEQVSRFAEDGYVIAEQIISASKARMLLRAIQRVIDEHYGKSSPGADEVSWYTNPQNVFWIINTRLLSSDVWSIATDPEISTPARALLQSSSIRLLEDQFMNKPPQGNGVALHQDAAYFPLAAGSRTISCWIALDDVTVEMGPIQVVPGTHSKGIGPLPTSLHEVDLQRDLQLAAQFSTESWRQELVDVCVPCGGGVFFDGTLVHGSARNSSSRWRPGFSLHFASGDSRFDKSKVGNVPDPRIYDGLVDQGELLNRSIPSLQ